MTGEIIVGYDSEHGGQDALRLGGIFSELLASRPKVVTALPWPDYLVGQLEVETEVEVEMREPFARVHDQLDYLGVETSAVASRTPAWALQEIASRDAARMIVVGSCHRGPVGRTLAGSVGESLLHGASCSVAVAPRGYGDQDQAQPQRIAVAFDGSSEAWAALETAIGLAERCHAVVSPIAVADYPSQAYGLAWEILSVGELRDAERNDKVRLLKLATSRIPEGLESGGRVLSGDPASVLSDISGEFDLMVAGSRGWGPLKRTMLGSTTRKLIRSCACPVLVLPRGVGVDPLGLRTDERVAVSGSTTEDVQWSRPISGSRPTPRFTP